MHEEKIKFVDFDRSFLEHSWFWLNDPEIKDLTSTPDFTHQEQLAFFNSLPREDYKVWGVEYEKNKIGVVGLKKINNSAAEYFGYIGNKQYWNKGFSHFLLHFIKCESKKINVGVIYLYVSINNIRAIKAYIKNGFLSDDSKRVNDMIYMSMVI